MHTPAKRVLSILFSVLMLAQPIMPSEVVAEGAGDAYEVILPDNAATPGLAEESTIEVQSQSVSAGMLNVQGKRTQGRRFNINWLPDDGIAPAGSYDVTAKWGNGSTETQSVSAQSGWACVFARVPEDAEPTYTVQGLDTNLYHCYPSDGYDFISVSEIAETPVIKTWYNTPESYRVPVTVTVTMVSGEDHTPGATGTIMDSITGLAGIGKEDGEVVVDEMTFRFPKYNSDGKIFHSFSIQEVQLDGHLINLDGKQEYKPGEEIHLHNTMGRALKVTKEWEGSYDNGNDEVTIELVRANDGMVMQTKTIRKDAQGRWPTLAFDTVPLGGKLDGQFQPFTYTVREVGIYRDDKPGDNLIDGYMVTYPPAPNWQTTGFTIQNSRKIDENTETVIEIVKTWDDARKPGFQLSTFTITRLNGADSSSSQVAVTGTGSETVTKQFRVPKYDLATGDEYVYHVQENANENFYNTLVRTEDGENKKTWYFLNESVKRDVTVEKIWKDDDPATRPEVTLYLLRDGVRIKDPDTGRDVSITLPQGQTTYTFENLPRFTEKGGREYVYTVEEASVPGYYSVANGLTVENHKQGGGDEDAVILVTKRWVPNGKYYETLPEITLQLYKVVEGQEVPVGNEMVMPAGTSLSKMFTILSSQGIEIDPMAEYIVRELTDSGGKWTVTEGRVVFDGNVGRVVLENILQENLIEREPTYTSLIIRKVWSVTDAPAGFASIEEYVATLPADFILTQSYDGGAYGVPVGEITWQAGSNTYNSTDGTAQIVGNGYIMLRVPEYDEHGKRYAYQVAENAIEGFHTTPSVSDYTFTYTNTQETVPIHARKTWLNLTQRGNVDVPAVTLTLFRRAGTQWEQVGQPVVLNNFDFGTDASGVYRWDEAALGQFATHAYVDGEFRAYEYQVVEEYDLTDKVYFRTEGREVIDGFADIKNIYDRHNEKTQFTVNKDWTGGLVGEIYPEVTIELYADGSPIDEVDLTAGSAVPWSHTFVDLPRYHPAGDGETPVEIVYTAKEIAIGGQEINAKNNYTVTIKTEDGDKVYMLKQEYMMGADDYYVVNHLITLQRELRYDIVGKKTWGTLPPGVSMPDSVTFVLYQDGKFYDRRTLTAKGGWACVFEQVKYFNEDTNRPYAYLLFEENPPAGFYPLIDEAMRFDRYENGELYAHATLINIPTDEREVTFVKKWEGDGGNTALRVDKNGEAKVVLTLSYGGGTRQVVLTPDGAGNWRSTITLPISDGQDEPQFIQYEMVEPSMPNHEWTENIYEGCVTATGERTFHLTYGEEDAVITVVNTAHQTTSVEGAKKWVDGLNASHLRPSTLSVVLEYYVEEDDQLVFSHEAGPLTVSTGSNGDIRADVHDEQDGDEMVTMWTWNYPAEKFGAQGEVYVHKWKEAVVPERYTCIGDDLYSYQLDGNVKPIVNRLELVDISGQKTWNNVLGETDYGAIHPSGITVQLMRRVGNGQPEAVDGYTAIATQQNRWTWTWEGLPKRDGNGNAYTYYVEETEAILGYITSDSTSGETEDGFTCNLTNTLMPGKLAVQKKWHADGPGAGRETVTVELTATIGGKVYTWTETLTEAEGWQCEFSDLPIYDHSSGQAIKVAYTLRELDLPAGYHLVTVIDAGGEIQYVPIEDATVTPITLEEDGATARTLDNALLMPLSGGKEWVDASNEHKTRPLDEKGDSILTVMLQRSIGGEFTTIGTQTFHGAGDTWTFAWPDPMPAFSPAGEAYTYRFVESVPTGYICENADKAIAADGSETLRNVLETTSVEGEKTWTGPDEEPSLRPGQISITLMRKVGDGAGVEIETRPVDVTQADPGSWLFDDLPAKDPVSGAAYIYYVVEAPLEGYTTLENGMDVENILKTGKIQVNKRWFEPEGAQIERPTGPIVLTLYATVPDGLGGTKTLFTRTHTIAQNSDMEWTHLFEDVPLYDSSSGTAVRIEYVLEESEINGYSLRGAVNNRVPVSFGEGDTADVTLVNESLRRDISVAKHWQGDEDVWQDTRPAKLVFELEQLDATGGHVKTHTLEMAPDQQGAWPEIIFRNLDIVDAQGNPYQYRLKELAVPGYASDVAMREDEDGTVAGFDVTNTWEPLTLHGIKAWTDGEDIAEIRPDTIMVRLLRKLDLPGASFEPYEDAEAIAPSGMVDENTWTFTWPRTVPAFNGKGERYVYQFEETATHPSYRIVQNRAEANTEEALANELPMLGIAGRKDWVEPEDSGYGKLEDLRPDTVTITLWRILGDERMQVGSKTVGKISGGEDWTWRFDNLPQYANHAQNIEYVYEVMEEKVPGYASAFVDGTVVNTLETVDITVRKASWGDAGFEDSRPDTLEIILVAGREGEEPLEFRADLTPDTWQHTFVNMPRYIGGKEVTYTVREVVPGGYIEGDYIDDGGNVVRYPVISREEKVGQITFGLENRLRLAEITLTKEWLEGDLEGKVVRPRYLYIDLWSTMSTLGDKTNPNATLVHENFRVEVPATNPFSVTFGGLPTERDGQPLHYWAEEREKVGYTQINEPGMTLANKIETVDVEIIKQWDEKDTSGEYGEEIGKASRPGSIDVTLVGAIPGREVYRQTHTLTAEDWTLTVRGLPRYAYAADGETAALVTYAIEEAEHAAYATTIDSSGLTPAEDGGYTARLTNRLKTIDVPVRKVFAGDEAMIEANVSVRPQSILIHLYRRNSNGAIDPAFHETKRIDGITDNIHEYTVSFTALPEYDADGNAYAYYAEEEPVVGYEAKVSEDGRTITNTLETTRLTGVKRWVDAPDGSGQYRTRPSQIVITLTRSENGVVDRTFHMEKPIPYEAVQEQAWAFEGLAKYAPSGAEYVYDVEEMPIAGYATEYAHDDGHVRVTNTLEYIRIQVDKVWAGDGDYTSYRPPAGLDVRLIGTGQDGRVYHDSTQTVIPPAQGGNTWTTMFENLPRLGNDGKTIRYIVSEEALPAYEMTGLVQPQVDENEGTTIYRAVITNSLRRQNYSGAKTWKDDEDKHQTRPNSITVTLKRTYRDAAGTERTETVANQTVSSPWRWTFDSLPTHHVSGAAYQYYVEESGLDKRYAVAHTGTDTLSLTNTLATQSITVTKKWEDNNNRNGLRPASLTIELLSSTGIRYPGVMTAARGWEFTYTGLPKYAQDGKLITYTLGEQVPGGYRIRGKIEQPRAGGGASYSASITNELATTQITVRKVWSGGNAIGRPPVTIRLMDGTRQVDTVQLSSAGWSHTFTGLPKYRTDGTEITYTVAEIPVPGYQATSWRVNTAEGAEYTITNTYYQTPSPGPTPTGRPGGGGGRTTTQPPAITPSPSASPSLAPDGRLVTIVDPDVPLGHGINLNLGDCFD